MIGVAGTPADNPPDGAATLERRVAAIVELLPRHDGIRSIGVARLVADMVMFEPEFVLDAATRASLVDRFFYTPADNKEQARIEDA